jgi:hypothetical protein
MTDTDEKQLAQMAAGFGEWIRPQQELDKAVPEAMDLKGATPAVREEILLQVGDWARRTQLAWIDKLSEGVDINREGLVAKTTKMREELAGPTPSPLEQLLVERIVSCWLQVNEAESRFQTREGGGSLVKGEYWQRRYDRAHRRFLQSLKALAQVRKLLGPNIQVNIAEKQVNVLEAGPARGRGVNDGTQI